QAYELQLLRAAGYGLEVSRCRICGVDATLAEALYFVIARGGVVCARCRPEAPESAVRIDGEIAQALTSLSEAPLTTVTAIRAAGSAATLALSRFLGSVMDRKLRSAAFLDSTL